MALSIVRLGTPRASGEGPRLGTVRRPPRGVPKSEFAAQNYYDVWLPTLAPSAELIKDTGVLHDHSRWAVLARRFAAELKQPGSVAPPRRARHAVAHRGLRGGVLLRRRAVLSSIHSEEGARRARGVDSAMTPGYSGTPLAKKLGFKDGVHVTTINAPDGYTAGSRRCPRRRPSPRGWIASCRRARLCHKRSALARTLKVAPHEARGRRFHLGVVAEAVVRRCNGHHRGHDPRHRAPAWFRRREGLAPSRRRGPASSW